jgi:uncharacterized protein YndB with AHSA1/START domain
MPLPNTSEPHYIIERTFDAPPEVVFRVWTDPRCVALWWGCSGCTNPICELDVRPGGAWRIDVRTTEGVTYPNRGVYIEVVPNERIVYSDIPIPESPAWDGLPPGICINTVTFEPDGIGTRVTLHARLSSQEDLDRMLRQGVRQGIGQSFDRVAAVLLQIQSRTPDTQRSAALPSRST